MRGVFERALSVLAALAWVVMLAGGARGDDGLQREAQRRGAKFVEAVNADDAR